jgi:hypothetical protein
MLRKDPDERMVIEEMRVRKVSALRLYVPAAFLTCPVSDL